MNSLEFIEFYIKEYKRSVEWYKKYQEKNPTSFVNTLKEEELILHHLQQIKSELEAWEVVKDKIIVKELPNYFYPQYCICLKNMNGKINKEQYEILKKSLEVKI